VDFVAFIIHVILWTVIILQALEIRRLRRKNRALMIEAMLDKNSDKMRQYRIAWRRKR
jgi:hypothetical protein